jgi:hypothetical protein
MWVRRSAILPVPQYAKVPESAVDAVHEGLADNEEEARSQLDQAFEQFEKNQPALATYIGEQLSDPLDDTALALGYFLALAIWMAFERTHGSELGSVSDEELNTARELLDLDESLRRGDPNEMMDSDDIIAMEQPALLSFVNRHLEATLQAHADNIDVDDVAQIYRAVLIEVLALSYAVSRPAGLIAAKAAMLA